jgi:hypothetical protein
MKALIEQPCELADNAPEKDVKDFNIHVRTPYNSPIKKSYAGSSLLFSLYSVLHCRLHRELGFITI